MKLLFSAWFLLSGPLKAHLTQSQWQIDAKWCWLCFYVSWTEDKEWITGERTLFLLETTGIDLIYTLIDRIENNQEHLLLSAECLLTPHRKSKNQYPCGRVTGMERCASAGAQIHPHICSSAKNRAWGLDEITDKKCKLFFNAAPQVVPCYSPLLLKITLNSGISVAQGIFFLFLH